MKFVGYWEVPNFMGVWMFKYYKQTDRRTGSLMEEQLDRDSTTNKQMGGQTGLQTEGQTP